MKQPNFVSKRHYNYEPYYWNYGSHYNRPHYWNYGSHYNGSHYWNYGDYYWNYPKPNCHYNPYYYNYYNGADWSDW